MSGRVEIRQEDIESGDGTVETALSLWLSQRSPCTFNQFQSAFYSLLRNFELLDEHAPEGETAAERGKRVFALYDEIQGSIHGPDHRDQARQLELEARAEAISRDFYYKKNPAARDYSKAVPPISVAKSEPKGPPPKAAVGGPNVSGTANSRISAEAGNLTGGNPETFLVYGQLTPRSGEAGELIEHFPDSPDKSLEEYPELATAWANMQETQSEATDDHMDRLEPVSYTHLTLPTILRV